MSVAFSKNGDRVFSACLDNNIHCWDVRRGKVQNVLSGHKDSVTGVRLSPDGNFLLSNASDNSLRMCVAWFCFVSVVSQQNVRNAAYSSCWLFLCRWDIRPFFAGEDRCIRSFRGPLALSRIFHFGRFVLGSLLK